MCQGIDAIGMSAGPAWFHVGSAASLAARAAVRRLLAPPTTPREQCGIARVASAMAALTDYSSLLLAIDFLLAMILLEIETSDPTIKLERVEARREAIPRRDSER